MEQKIMFPKSTELSLKFIAKEKFYVNGDFNPKLKATMTADIAKIVASHKFSVSTLNITVGKIFSEIIVLHITLKKKEYNPKLLDAMDKSIRPAFVLFILEFEEKISASIAFKNKNGDSIIIVKRWTTVWNRDMELKIEGRSIDSVYEGFIRQISGGKLIKNPDKTLKEKVAHIISSEKIDRQIKRLETKMKNESQLKKKLEIKAKIKELKEQL